MDQDIHVLHVDDDPTFIEMASIFLNRHSDRITVTTETSAKNAISTIEENAIDCIVSDYDMPMLNGIEFLKQVRQNHPDLPFILFTGKGSEEVASEAISAGVTDYLQKQTATEQYELLANRIEHATAQCRAESQITEQQAVFETLIENLPVGVLVEDQSREVLAVNQELLEIFEVTESKQTFIGAYCPDIANKLKNEFKDPDRFIRSIDERLQVTEPVEGETFTLVDGRTIERDYVPYELPNGCANLWVYTDVTRQQENQQLLEGLFEQSLQAIAFKEIVTDENGEPIDYTYLQVNERFEEIMEVAAEEIIGRRGTETIDGLENDPFIEIFGEVALEGSSVSFEEYSTALNRHYDVSVFSPREGAFITIFSDITDRKERERELEQFRFFVENTPDFMLVLDASMNVQYQSPISDAAAVRPIDVTGKHPTEYIHPDDIETVIERFQQLVEDTETIVTAEYRVQDASGNWCWFESKAQNYLNEDPVNGVLVTVREITKQKEQHRKLKEQNKRLGQFASVVSHDLRGPLNVAMGRIELLSDDCESEHIDQIQIAVERMNTLIEDLLQLAQDGTEIGATQVVSIPKVCQTAWDAVVTGDANLQIETDRTITADIGRLQQLLENLFRNAIEHNTQPVTITVGDIPETDSFYVEDTGVGIPRDLVDDIFEIGFSTKPENTGFGLAIVNEIATAHEWNVDVTTGSAGGARFVFTPHPAE